jgi:hypothetical protein
MKLLIDAVKAWKAISKSVYIITYGFRKKKYCLNLEFLNSHFYHLAGLQYLKDVELPKVSKSKLCQYILEHHDKLYHLKKSEFWLEWVEPRLNALISLEKLLDGDYRLYKYNPKFSQFYSDICADYLITDPNTNQVIFLFLGKDDNKHFQEQSYNVYCRSIFIKTKERDHTQCQRLLSILSKEKVVNMG